MDLMKLATDERADIVAFLEGLRPDDWDQPSLCPGWSVRDVAAHLISYDLLSPVGTVQIFIRGGLSVDRINAIGVDRARALDPSQIVDQIRSHQRPSGLTAGFKGGIGLTDGVIHHQDMRRALGRPREVPLERLREALPFALKAPTLKGRKLARGLTLVATDQAWRSGSGPEVHASSEVLLMAIAGRRAVLDDLAGEGAPILVQRVMASSS